MMTMMKLSSEKNLNCKECHFMNDFKIKKGVLLKYHGADSHVVIPDGVTSIGTNAFYDCSGLTSVIIPDTVTNIEEKAFFCCSNLKSLKLPECLTSIEKNTFSYCMSLTDVKLPAHLTHIKEGAFLRCYNLQSVTFPEKLTSIDDVAFFKCYYLKHADIPKSVTYIGEKAFMGCIALKRIPLICTDGTVIYEPEYKIKFKFSDIQKLVLEREYSVSLYPLFKYDILFQMYMLDMDITGISAYIKEHFREMFRFLIDKENIKGIQKILASGDIVTKDNIDDAVEYAIDNQKHEIQLILTDYKMHQGWYDDNETGLSKKFSL